MTAAEPGGRDHPPFFAVDAGTITHNVISAMSGSLPSSLNYEGQFVTLFERENTRIMLPRNESTSNDQVLEALHSINQEGLRHFAVILAIMTSAGRCREVKWSCREHLAVMGYHPAYARNSKLAQQVSDIIRLFAKIEIVHTNRREQASDRFKLLDLNVIEADIRDEQTIRAAELRLNQKMYEGVRKANGKMGTNWYPAPAALAGINHHHFPYCSRLGMLLPVRFRLARNENKDILRYKGASWLETAGIDRTNRRRWHNLKSSLDKLKEINLIGCYEWEGHPWSEEGICIVKPADWILDHFNPESRRREHPGAPLPIRGSELKIWRQRYGLTQQEASRLLDVSSRTLQRAECMDRLLTPHIHHALRHPELIDRLMEFRGETQCDKSARLTV